MSWFHFDVSAIDTDCGFCWDKWLTNKGSIQLPYLVVLCNGKRAQGTIKCAASLCDGFLKSQEGEEFLPDTGHFGHEDETSLKDVVEVFPCGVCDALLLDIFDTVLWRVESNRKRLSYDIPDR